MKAILIFALVAIAACNELPVEQLETNPIDTVKCIVEKALPLLPQVTEIITAIKEQDIMTAMFIDMSLFEEIKEIIKKYKPAQKEELLSMDLPAFARCAITVGGVAGIVFKLVTAINTGNTSGAIALIPEALAYGGKVIQKCGHFLR